MKKPTEYIREAISIYFKKENFIFFAKIMAVISLASLIVGFVSGYFYPTEGKNYVDFSNMLGTFGFISISAAAFVLGIWGQTTTYISILKMGKKEKEIFSLGYKNMWKFFLASLVVGLIILGGIILLIIPAVIFGIWYSFTLILVLDKNLSIKEALSKSKKMVSGKFMKIFGRFIVFGLFSLVVSIILSMVPFNLGSLAMSFASPLFILPTVLLYRDLVAGD